MVQASIITIGDELLIGQVIDTNSSWMAKELNNAGLAVKLRLAVGDSKQDILYAIEECRRQSTVVLITGGLGPTNDDITKNVLCEYFNAKMIVNEEALQNVKHLFENIFKRPLTPVNIKQAEVPDVATVIPNKRGTAPGMWFDKDTSGKIFISMPGVPHEMKGMMTDYVIPRLRESLDLPFIFHRTLLTAGIGESMLAEKIKDFESSLPGEIKLAYLPSNNMVRLRLSTSGYDMEGTKKVIDEKFSTLQQLVNEHLITTEDEPLAQVIGKILTTQNKFVATAESCTGGYIAHLLTSVAGSSSFYKGTVVSYNDEVKRNVLNVHDTVLKAYGAVSEQAVKEMVRGVLTLLNTDYAVAVSGIMGPSGGTEEKPVGTVWIAVGDLNGRIKTQKFHFRFDRMRNIEMTAITALNFLRKFMLTADDSIYSI